MGKLSVVISAYNEEKNIQECLESVSDIASEIVFVDNSSTDDTVKIAKKYTDAIFIRENNLMLNVNKNFGFTKAKNEWILSLDADERVTDELAGEIKNILAGQSDVNGHHIPRKNILFGKWIEHTGWYPDHQMRLFKKGKGKFEEKHVHEMIVVDGETANLTNHLIHKNYDSITQFIQKTATIYAPNEAENLLENGYQFHWHDALRMPLTEFLSRYFSREGYKDGFHGLMLSMLMSFYHFVIFCYLWEKQSYSSEKDPSIVEVKHEFKKARKQLQFWFAKEEEKQTSSIFKKAVLKISQKVSR